MDEGTPCIPRPTSASISGHGKFTLCSHLLVSSVVKFDRCVARVGHWVTPPSDELRPSRYIITLILRSLAFGQQPLVLRLCSAAICRTVVNWRDIQLFSSSQSIQKSSLQWKRCRIYHAHSDHCRPNDSRQLWTLFQQSSLNSSIDHTLSVMFQNPHAFKVTHSFPRLKKAVLSWSAGQAYRPISNLSIISKLLDCSYSPSAQGLSWLMWFILANPIHTQS